MYDISREIQHYTSRLVVTYCRLCARFGTGHISLPLLCRNFLRRLKKASGTYGMVAVPDKTTLLHPLEGRLQTGGSVRVVQPAEVIRTLPWTLEDNKSCGLRFTFDLQRCRSLGILAVRDSWCTIIFRDEIGFAE